MAKFKASLFEGNEILILAAGLGVDDWAFSKSFKQVISIEPNVELNSISEFNFNTLKINNISRISTDAETFLNETNIKFDLIYLDPDRRQDDARQILLSQHNPNVIALLPLLKEKSNQLLIKCSPMYDYEMALKELHHIESIYSVSRNGEMKELLIECDFNRDELKPLRLVCVDLSIDTKIEYESYDTKQTIPDNFFDSGLYFYEAGSSLVKMRKHHEYALKFGLRFINQTVPYYVSDNEHDNFLGRSFKLISSIDFSASKAKRYLKENHILKANIKVRGLKYKTADIVKSLGIVDGGEDYIFILPYKETVKMFHCKK